MRYERHTSVRMIGVLVALASLLSGIWPGSAHADDDDVVDQSVPKEVVAKLKTTADAPAVAARFGLTVLDQFGARPIYRFAFADRRSPSDKAKQVLSDSHVEFAEPNYVAQAPENRQQASWSIGGDAGAYQEQWAPAKLRLAGAHAITNGAGVKVAVLDTGADLDHPQLAGHWLRNGSAIVGYDFVDGDADPREVGTRANAGYGHGTHVAGLVALAAPGALIMPIRVLDENGVGNVWVLNEALAWAVANGADVVNLSIGTTRKTSLLSDTIGGFSCDDDDDDQDCYAAIANGVVVVAASGNGGGSTPEYPAAENHYAMLAVAASTQNDRLAPFATRGGWVDLMAPGDRVLSTVPGGEYGTWSGTSMAAPLVTGQAALLRAQCGARPAIEIIALVKYTGTYVGGPVPRRSDALASVQAATRAGCRNTPALYGVER